MSHPYAMLIYQRQCAVHHPSNAPDSPIKKPRSPTPHFPKCTRSYREAPHKKWGLPCWEKPPADFFIKKRVFPAFFLYNSRDKRYKEAQEVQRTSIEHFSRRQDIKVADGENAKIDTSST